MSAKADPIDESFETRVIRNALGQLKELAALEVSEHQPRVKRDAEKLREKLLRTRKVDLERPRYLEITRLERILESVRKKELDERMQRWKNRMRENPSHVFRWQDGKQGPPIHNIYDECDDDATQNIAEVLETLACHCRKVWKRPSPELSDLRETLQRTLGPAREIQKWSAVSGAELEKEAKKQTGAAASIDGWSGDEVAPFPSVIWDRIALFSQYCERLFSAPEQFGFARQAHLPKECKEGLSTRRGPPRCGHAADHHTHGVVASLGTCSTQKQCDCHLAGNVDGSRNLWWTTQGGCAQLRHKNPGSCMENLWRRLIAPWHLTTNPAMYGMPEGTARLLKSVWQSWQRTFQYAGESLKTAELVMTSFPQGEAWSMIAMAAVLLILLCDLRGAIPNTDILLYVDDRSWASQSAQDCVKFGKKWKTWSSRLGLKENATKEKYYHENPVKAMKDFVTAGVQAKTIDPNLALLGVELAPREGRELTIKEAARLETARKIALKCQCLPGAAARNLLIASMKATPRLHMVCSVVTRQRRHFARLTGQ